MGKISTRYVFACAAAAAILLVAAAPAGAGHSWNGYHWAGTGAGDKGLPVQVTLASHVDPLSPWSGILGMVGTDWNVSAELESTLVPGLFDPAACELPTTAPAAADYTVDVCNGEYGENGWLGLAQIWVAPDGHILTGSAKVNDTYFNQDAYNDDNARRHVLCQEVGHDWGLDHVHGPKAASCMNDMFGLFSPSFVSPNQHDYDQLAAIYCHLGDSPCGRAKGGGGKGKSNSKSQVVERHQANGARLVTFILRP